MERVVFGGVELSDMFGVVGVERPMTRMAANLVSVPGRNGYALNGGELVPGRIKFTLVSRSADARQRRKDATFIAAKMLTDEASFISFGSDDGLSYLVVPDGEISVEEHVMSGATTVKLQVLDAAMYGEERTVTVPSGGQVSFMVHGSYPTRPVITSNATHNVSSLIWGLRLDEGEFIHVHIDTHAVTPVVADCTERTLTVNGEVAIPTLDSDWLEFEPGEHTLRMDSGYGTARVKFRERWLR